MRLQQQATRRSSWKKRHASKVSGLQLTFGPFVAGCEHLPPSRQWKAAPRHLGAIYPDDPKKHKLHHTNCQAAGGLLTIVVSIRNSRCLNTLPLISFQGPTGIWLFHCPWAMTAPSVWYKRSPSDTKRKTWPWVKIQIVPQ